MLVLKLFAAAKLFPNTMSNAGQLRAQTDQCSLAGRWKSAASELSSSNPAHHRAMSYMYVDFDVDSLWRLLLMLF
jgi:hypothetical protein